MKHRSELLSLTFLALFAALVPLNGQSRGVAGTVSAEAPVMLLPEDGRTPLATLSEGTRVQVLDAPEQGWYRISFQDNYLFGDRVGYVRAEHVEVYGRVPGASPERALTPGAAHKALTEPPSSAVNSASIRSSADGDRSTTNGTLPHTNGTPAAPPVAADPASAGRRPRALSDSSIATAIILGQRQQDGSEGLWLLESGESWTRTAIPARARSGFRLQIHTPLAWIQQKASEAARAGRRFSLADVTDDMTEPVLRVVAYSGSAAAGSLVRHVALRSDSKPLVVQPISKEAFSEHVLRAAGGSTISEGLRVTFPMEAVRRLRGPAGDAEFFVTVTDASGQKRDVRITRAHMNALPM